MNESIKNAILVRLTPKKEPLFEYGYRMDNEMVSFIKSLNPSGPEFSKLFGANGLGATSVTVELACEKCGNLEEMTLSKTKFFEYIKKGFVCDSCEEKERVARENDRKQRKQEIESHKEECTLKFISAYLDPNKHWCNKREVNTPSKKCRDMEEWLPYCDEELIAEHIRATKYSDFLQTPYWKAISAYVKSRNEYKCEICGKGDTALHIHHPNYKIHGYELQYYNRKQLKCLCSDCHRKFHEIEE